MSAHEWEWLGYAVVCLVAFLLGSLPFGRWIARAYVSSESSFWPAGFLTYFLDFIKGALATGIAWAWVAMPEAVSGLIGVELVPAAELPWVAGFFSVLGHCHTPWQRFKGGKGVATGFGALLILSPVAALIGALAFALSFLMTRTGSLASIAGAMVASVAHLVLYPTGNHLWAGAALIALILLGHESDLDALLESRENVLR